MRTTSNHRPLHRLLAVLALAAVAVAACGNADDDDAAPAESTTTDGATDTTAGADDELGEFQPIEGVPGVTDDEIRFAVLGTGPANPLGYCLLECYEAGVQAYFDYRNSIGGVHGRDLVIGRSEDDELANTQVKLLELLEDPDVFGIFAAPLIYAGFPEVGATDVPLYTTFPAALDADGFDNIYIPVGVQCVTCESPVTTLAASLVGASKVASLGTGAAQASKDCVQRSASEIGRFGPGVGVEFAYANDTLPFGFPNGVGPEVQAMKEAGVDLVTLCLDQNSAVTLEQELRRQGLDDVVVALPQGYGDERFLADNADLLEGDIMTVPFRPVEADPADSMVPTMTEWLEKTGVEVNDYAIQGWMGADLAVTGLLEAGPAFDQAGVVGATNGITDWTAGGLLPPIDWTKAHDAPGPDDPATICMAILEVRSGALELVGDPAEPFHCFDLPMDEWAEPRTYG